MSFQVQSSHLALVQVAALFLLEVTDVGCTRVRLGTIMGGVPSCAVGVQPAETVKLCVAMTIE